MLQKTLYSFLIISIIGVQMVSIERNENYVVNEKVDEKLLSRKRRYLTFPEGSSMQLGELAAYFVKRINSNLFLMCLFCVVVISLRSDYWNGGHDQSSYLRYNVFVGVATAT